MGLLPSHTTVHECPHTAVRRFKLSGNRQSRKSERVEVGIGGGTLTRIAVARFTSCCEWRANGCYSRARPALRRKLRFYTPSIKSKPLSARCVSFCPPVGRVNGSLLSEAGQKERLVPIRIGITFCLGNPANGIRPEAPFLVEVQEVSLIPEEWKQVLIFGRTTIRMRSTTGRYDQASPMSFSLQRVNNYDNTRRNCCQPNGARHHFSAGRIGLVPIDACGIQTFNT